MKYILFGLILFSGLVLGDSRELKKLDASQSNQFIFGAITKAQLLSDSREFGKVALVQWLARISRELEKKNLILAEEKWIFLMQGGLDRYRAAMKPLGATPTKFSALKATWATLSELALNGLSDWNADVVNIVRMETGAALMNFTARYAKTSSYFLGAERIETEMLSQWQKIGTEIDELSRLAKKDLGFRSAFNKTLGPESGVFIESSAKDNLSRNLQYWTRANEANETARANALETTEDSTLQDSVTRVLRSLAKSLNPEGELNLNYETERKQSRELFDAALGECRRHQTAMVHYFANPNTKNDAAKFLFDLIEVKYSAARVAHSLLNSLTQKIDPDFAGLHEKTGLAIFAVSLALENFILTRPSDGKKDISAFGMISLAISLGNESRSLFEFFLAPDSKYPDQLYLEQIKELGEHVKSVGELLVRQKDAVVDPRLSPLFENTAAGFDELKQLITEGTEFGKASSKKEKLQETIFSLKTQLGFLGTYDDGKSFADLLRELERPAIRCQGTDAYMFPANFEWCLQEFTVTKEKPVAQSEFGAETNEDQIFGRLRQDPKGTPVGLWKSLGFAAQVLKFSFKYDNFVTEQGTKAASCDAWRIVARNFVEFVSLHPKNAVESALTLNQLKRLQEYSGVCNEVSSLGPAVSPENHLLLRVIDKYEKGLQEIKDAVNKKWKDLEKAEASGLDLTRDIKDQKVQAALVQTDNFGRPLYSIAKCLGEEVKDKFPDNVNLPYPANLGEVIPNEFHLASILSLGSIAVCYRDVKWEPEGSINYIWIDTPRTQFPRDQREFIGEQGSPREYYMFLDGWKKMYREHPELRKKLKPHYGTTQSRVSFELKFSFLKNNDLKQAVDFSARRITTQAPAGRYWKIVRYGDEIVEDDKKDKNAAKKKSEDLTKSASKKPDKKPDPDDEDKGEKETKLEAPVPEQTEKKVGDPLYSLPFEVDFVNDNGLSAGGWSKASSESISLARDELQREWGKYDGLMTNFKNLSVEKEAAKKFLETENIFKLVKEKFNALKKLVNDRFKVLLDQAEAVGEKSKSISGLKELLKICYATGFPESFYTNDVIHDAFFGAIPLLDFEGLPDVLANQTFDVLSYQRHLDLIDQKLKNLKAVTLEIVKLRANAERQLQMIEIRDELDLLSLALQFKDGRESIEKVYNDLKGRANQFAAESRN